MAEIVLRDLRADDREAIAGILQSVGVFRPDEVAVALALVDETLNPGPGTDYRWIVAARDGPVEGFACFGAIPLTEGAFDLYWIAVDPRAWGRRVAVQIDQAVTADVRRAGGRWLVAETSGTPPYRAAHRFYQKQGYALLARLPDFYRAGDDKLIFGKRVDPGAADPPRKPVG